MELFGLSILKMAGSVLVWNGYTSVLHDWLKDKDCDVALYLIFRGTTNFALNAAIKGPQLPSYKQPKVTL
jgi:hypothetical protein